MQKVSPTQFKVVLSRITYGTNLDQPQRMLPRQLLRSKSYENSTHEKYLALMIDVLCSVFLLLLFLSFTQCKFLQCLGQPSLRGGASVMFLSSTRVLVKRSKVFHWAGSSDTLPKDPHSASRERTSLFVKQFSSWCCGSSMLSWLQEGGVGKSVTSSNSILEWNQMIRGQSSPCSTVDYKFENHLSVFSFPDVHILWI